MRNRLGTSVLLIFLMLTQTAFDFSKHSISLNKILDGGPPKDGIPALYDPSVRVTDDQGWAVPSVQAYWFAWAAFRPETGLHS